MYPAILGTECANTDEHQHAIIALYGDSYIQLAVIANVAEKGGDSWLGAINLADNPSELLSFADLITPEKIYFRGPQERVVNSLTTLATNIITSRQLKANTRIERPLDNLVTKD